jgi:drug/metabolite transporter (DMT)-like permease
MERILTRKRGGRMGGRTILGIALIVIGLFALAYQGFSYTTQKKVVDIGPIQATKEEHHTIPLPPILGALALISGVVVVVAGRREN